MVGWNPGTSGTTGKNEQVSSNIPSISSPQRPRGLTRPGDLLCWGTMNWASSVPRAVVVLLSLCCKTAAALPGSDGAGFRSLEVHPGGSGKAGFTLMNPKETGVGFTNLLHGD